MNVHRLLAGGLKECLKFREKCSYEGEVILIPCFSLYWEHHRVSDRVQLLEARQEGLFVRNK
jgi:hypothetical protein